MRAARLDRRIILLLAAVLLLRLPFLDQAIQGDDIYYLAGAQHAQIDPLHPNHAKYVFLGQVVDMRGHPHPPLNAWFLGALLALFGDIREVPFHAAYLLFSLVAVFSMWSLARRFSPRPFLATLLFLATPAFVVNGASLEADVPFLALWLAATALFVSAVDARDGRRLVASAGALCLAALAAYQSALLVPVLAFYLWTRRRDWRPAWLVVLVVPAVLAGWQVWERAATGDMPVVVLSRYFQEYGLQVLARKLTNAAALTAHLAWLIFPLLAAAAFAGRRRLPWIAAGPAAAVAAHLDPHPLFWTSFGIGVLVLAGSIRAVWRPAEASQRFLAAWLLVFFGGALVLFFAGSARYLLPAVAPAAILTTRALEGRPRWLAAGVLAQLAVSLAMCAVNFQHWDGYRRFAARFRQETEERRVWINGEWGLRFYFEANGGLPIQRGQAVQPGDRVVSSELAFPIEFTTGGGVLAPVAEEEIRASLPFRIAGLGSRSAYSTAALGLRPFDLSTGPIDRLRMQVVVERKPASSRLSMNAPEAGQQIVSGVYELEGGAWRWMSDRAVVLLKRPDRPLPLAVAFHIPRQSPARRVTVSVDGAKVAEQTYEGPGTYILASAPYSAPAETALVTIALDKSFAVPGDHRTLGIILIEVGFRQ